MNNKFTLASHEALDLHEILSFKNICAVKCMAMQTLIKDEELKNLVSQDITTTSRQMQEIQNVLSSASLGR